MYMCIPPVFALGWWRSGSQLRHVDKLSCSRGRQERSSPRAVSEAASLLRPPSVAACLERRKANVCISATTYWRSDREISMICPLRCGSGLLMLSVTKRAKLTCITSTVAEVQISVLSLFLVATWGTAVAAFMPDKQQLTRRQWPETWFNSNFSIGDVFSCGFLD